MTFGRPNPLLAWALLVTVAATYYEGVYRSAYAYRNELALEHSNKVEHLYRLDGILDKQQRQFADTGVQERSEDRLKSYFIESESSTSAASALQRLVSEAAARTGVEQTSIQPMPPQTDDLIPRLLLTAQLQGPWPAVHEFLRILETNAPRIYVDELVLESKSSSGGAASRSPRRQVLRRLRTPSRGSPGNISARISVRSYMYGESQ